MVVAGYMYEFMLREGLGSMICCEASSLTIGGELSILRRWCANHL